MRQPKRFHGVVYEQTDPGPFDRPASLQSDLRPDAFARLALGAASARLAFELADGSFADEELTARLLRDARVLVQPAARVSLLVARAERASAAGKFADAVCDLEAALACEPSDARFQERFTWYGRLGVALAAQGLFSRALGASQTALDLAIVLDDASYMVEALISISNHEYAVDRDDLALQALEYALVCVKTGGLAEGELHVSIGSSLVRRHERAAAREHLERARALAHAAGERHPREALELDVRVLLGLVEDRLPIERAATPITKMGGECWRYATSLPPFCRVPPRRKVWGGCASQTPPNMF